MSMLSMVLIVLLVLVFVWQMSIAPKREFLENCFSRTVTKGLQGYMALLIIVHHIYTFLNSRGVDVEELQIFEGIGVYLIGFFFFCSGYGLLVSLQTKQDYLKGFLIKRVLMVLVPFFICNYLYLFAELLLGVRFPMHELLATFFGVLLLNTQMWFAVEIMLLYLVFYFTFKHVRKTEIGIAIIAVVIVGMTILGMCNHYPETFSNWFWGEWWYNTTPLFVLGMLMAQYRERWYDFAKKHYKSLLLLFGLLTVALSVMSGKMLDTHGYWTCRVSDKIVTYLVQMPSVICFILLLQMLLMKVRINNLLLDFLGKFSLEIILVNGVFLELFLQRAIENGIVCYVCLSYACTFVTAVLLYKLKRYILEIR